MQVSCFADHLNAAMALRHLCHGMRDTLEARVSDCGGWHHVARALIHAMCISAAQLGAGTASHRDEKCAELARFFGAC